MNWYRTLAKTPELKSLYHMYFSVILGHPTFADVNWCFESMKDLLNRSPEIQFILYPLSVNI